MRKYQVGDEIVLLVDPSSYNYGVRFKITKIFFQIGDDHKECNYSYEIQSIMIDWLYYHKREEDLHWIPAGTVDRPREK